MYGCESWTIKKAKRQRIGAFALWCWRRLLKVPWTARRPNLSILSEINPEYSLEGLKLKPKLQYFGHPMWRADSLEKTLKLVRIEDRRRMGQQRMRWLMALVTQWSWAWASSGRWWRTRKPGCRHPWCHKESDTTEWLNDNNNLPHKLPHLLELAQTHADWVGDAILPSHHLSSPSPPAFNLSQCQGLFQWVSSSYQVAKVLEFQL